MVINPPMGHDVLINKLKSIADGDAVFVFASQSNDPSRNPFDYKTKTKYEKGVSGCHGCRLTKVKNMFDAIEMLGKKHDEVVMVVGGDRLASIKRSVPTAKRMGINLKVVSAGARILMRREQKECPHRRCVQRQQEMIRCVSSRMSQVII